MILDITAGNRHIYGGWMPRLPEGRVVFLDIEERLKRPPDVIADNRRLPFRDGSARSVVYDPPYITFGSSAFHGDPEEKAGGCFYGKYGNKRKLMLLLSGGVKAIRRVLEPRGLLYLKWCDTEVPLRRVLPIFLGDFEEIGRMERESRSGRTKAKTYWLTLRLKPPL